MKGFNWINGVVQEVKSRQKNNAGGGKWTTFSRIRVKKATLSSGKDTSDLFHNCTIRHQIVCFANWHWICIHSILKQKNKWNYCSFNYKDKKMFKNQTSYLRLISLFHYWTSSISFSNRFRSRFWENQICLQSLSALTAPGWIKCGKNMVSKVKSHILKSQSPLNTLGKQNAPWSCPSFCVLVMESNQYLLLDNVQADA